ncbi:MAG: DUF192 domain-containing protein [Spirochaetaceae bacterium]|nr:MAG: DUF192 domain-containing protein [Spirochaetaceae bacterium]
MSIHVRTLALMLVATASFASCRDDRNLYELRIGSVTFHVEVVDTPETRERGLMERESLDPRHGMLFVFDESAHRSFWMKNTIIPLSIAYIDDRLAIREIHSMEPLSLEPIPSRLPARYALEVNQNEFDALGIGIGARIVPSERLSRRLSR